MTFTEEEKKGLQETFFMMFRLRRGRCVRTQKEFIEFCKDNGVEDSLLEVFALFENAMEEESKTFSEFKQKRLR